MKELEDMTLAELWELFPVVLVEHQDAWREQYQREKESLENIFGQEHPVAIHHIGSTAIEGIWAKPIVDILVEASDVEERSQAELLLEEHGYIRMAPHDFNKGYTPEGFADEVFHIHMRLAGDDDEIAFRDYLNAHPNVAKEYEALKLSLWKQYEHDRDAYTDAKSAFVKECLSRAKRSTA